MLRVGIWVESFKCTGILFYNGKVKTLRIDNIWNSASISLFTVPAKSYISKGIQPIFQIFASGRRCWGWAFGWKVSSAQVFYFYNGKVKTLRIDNIGNFALSTCSLCQQNPISPQVFTDFRNLCFSSKMLRVGILLESFRCGGILFLYWQG